jgi:hypothetical protein
METSPFRPAANYRPAMHNSKTEALARPFCRHYAW